MKMMAAGWVEISRVSWGEVRNLLMADASNVPVLSWGLLYILLLYLQSRCRAKPHG